MFDQIILFGSVVRQNHWFGQFGGLAEPVVILSQEQTKKGKYKKIGKNSKPKVIFEETIGQTIIVVYEWNYRINNYENTRKYSLVSLVQVQKSSNLLSTLDLV